MTSQKGLFSFYHVEYFTQAPTEKLLLNSLDLLHEPGLSKSWFIYIRARVIGIFYENMYLVLTSFGIRVQNIKSDDW